MRLETVAGEFLNQSREYCKAGTLPAECGVPPAPLVGTESRARGILDSVFEPELRPINLNLGLFAFPARMASHGCKEPWTLDRGFCGLNLREGCEKSENMDIIIGCGLLIYNIA